MRAYSITLSGSVTTAQNLWALINALSNVQASGEVIPDKCCYLHISCVPTSSNTVEIQDSHALGGPTFKASGGLLQIEIKAPANNINLRDYNFLPSAISQVVNVLTETV